MPGRLESVPKLPSPFEACLLRGGFLAGKREAFRANVSERGNPAAAL